MTNKNTNGKVKRADVSRMEQLILINAYTRILDKSLRENMLKTLKYIAETFEFDEEK